MRRLKKKRRKMRARYENNYPIYLYEWSQFLEKIFD
jgi:hypothetical protein